MMRQLLHVVNQAVKPSLRIHLRSRPQRKAVQPLVEPQVREHRLHGREPAPVQSSPAGHSDVTGTVALRRTQERFYSQVLNKGERGAWRPLDMMR